MGVMRRWFDIFVNNQTDIMKYYFQRGADPELFKPLSLGDFHGAFCVLGIGLTLSTIVFILENVIHWWKTRGKQKSNVNISFPSEVDPPFPFTL